MLLRQSAAIIARPQDLVFAQVEVLSNHPRPSLSSTAILPYRAIIRPERPPSTIMIGQHTRHPLLAHRHFRVDVRNPVLESFQSRAEPFRHRVPSSNLLSWPLPFNPFSHILCQQHSMANTLTSDNVFKGNRQWRPAQRRGRSTFKVKWTAADYPYVCRQLTPQPSISGMAKRRARHIPNYSLCIQVGTWPLVGSAIPHACALPPPRPSVTVPSSQRERNRALDAHRCHARARPWSKGLNEANTCQSCPTAGRGLET